MKNLMPAILVACSISLGGCASSGAQSIRGGEVADPLRSFEAGEIRLTCGISCSGSWGSQRATAKALHNNHLWVDLANLVLSNGFKADQTYYYLGRAAEGLGHYSSAETYYRLSMASDYKCGGLMNVCDDFVFPRDVNIRLKEINSLIENAKVDQPLDPIKNKNVDEYSDTSHEKRNEENNQHEGAANNELQPNPLVTKSPEGHTNISRTTANSNPDQSYKYKVTVKYDEFRKRTKYEGQELISDNDSIFLRAWKDDNREEVTFQIYVADVYKGDWRLYSSAWDTNGNSLDLTKIHHEVITCVRGCLLREHIGININRDYLQGKSQGFKFKIAGNGGEEVFFIPGDYISSFINAVYR